MKPRPARAMIDTCPQSASLSAAQTARGWFGHRSVARAVTGSAPAARWSGTSLAIVLAGIRLGRAWRAVAVYAPPLTAACRVLAGPAAVR